jgi:hypothetical protein
VVVAHGIAGQCRELRALLWTLGAAYAVQFALVLVLWAMNFPAALHISIWAKAGVWLGYTIVCGVYEVTINLLATEESRPNLKRLWCAADGSRARSRVLRLAAWQSFSKGLSNYCLFALIFPRFSWQVLVAMELVWFAAGVGPPCGTTLPDRPEALRPFRGRTPRGR